MKNQTTEQAKRQAFIEQMKTRPHWIRWVDDDSGFTQYQCSECGAKIHSFPQKRDEECFYCGKRMVESCETVGLIEEGGIHLKDKPRSRYEWRAEDGTRMFQALLVRVGRAPCLIRVGNFYSNLEAIIGADDMWEMEPFGDGCVILYDHVKQSEHSEPNRVLRDPKTGEIVKILYGDFLVTGRLYTDEEYKAYLKYYDLDDFDEPLRCHGLSDGDGDVYNKMFETTGAFEWTVDVWGEEE